MAPTRMKAKEKPKTKEWVSSAGFTENLVEKGGSKTTEAKKAKLTKDKAKPPRNRMTPRPRL